MKLIKTIGPRSWVTSGGNKTSATFGIFECPTCKTHKELSLTKGRRNKSCGNIKCRKKTFVPNLHNLGNTKANKITDLPLYTNIKEQYRLLKISNKLCVEWQTLSGFMADMYDSYVSIKGSNTASKVTLAISGNILNPAVCKWELVTLKDELTLAHPSEFNSYRLAEALGLNHRLVAINISKMVALWKSFGSIEKIKGTFNKKTKYSTTVYGLTSAQYQTAFNRLTLLSRDYQVGSGEDSTHIYVLRSAGKVKIGVTSSPDKRINALKAACPDAVEVITVLECARAYAMEQALHTHYVSNHVHHEWFSLSDTQVQEAITFIKGNT